MNKSKLYETKSKGILNSYYFVKRTFRHFNLFKYNKYINKYIKLKDVIICCY